MKNHLFLLLVILFTSFTSLLYAQNFAGKYTAVQNDVNITIDFKQAANQQLTGELIIGSDKGTLKGAVANGIASGTITDATTKQIFTFESAIENNTLTFIMYVKNEDTGVNIPLTFVLERSNGGASQNSTAATPSFNTGNLDPTKAPKKTRDAKLAGIWRTTETMNSGSGDFYMGMSTDYFMQFTKEGIAGVWQGKSAGGGAGSSFSSEGDSQITQIYWYSEPSYFVLVDPNSKEELRTKYQFHEGQLVTTNQNGKYVFWTKVQ